MECPNCGAENTAEDSFCTQCGQELEITCPECEQTVDDSDNFCGNCGTELSDSDNNSEDTSSLPGIKSPTFSQDNTSQGDRRPATILFADLQGFTSMADDEDPEEVREMLNQCFEKMSEIIENYGGTVDKYIGDAVLALFGVPVAHEDDPTRSILSALEMRDKIDQLGREQGKNLRLKIGINTGLVVHGSVGSESSEEITAIGDTVNLASRLQDMANANQILISDNTFEQIEGRFECRALWDQKIKGKDETVDVYEVLKELPNQTDNGSSQAINADFVGRDAELQLLKKYCDQSLNGQGQVVSVVGKAGIGKSRLVYELFNTYLHKKDIVHSKGRALSYAQTTTYKIFKELLKDFLGLDGASDSQKTNTVIQNFLEKLGLEESEHLPPLKNILGIETESEEFQKLSLEERKEQIFASVKNILTAQAREKPVVLFFEDLHWVDQSSYELITHLINHIRQTSILIICGFRPEFSHDWSNLNHYSQLTLQELTDEESQKMMESILGEKEIQEDLKEYILEKSQGNPLYVEEIIGAMKNTELINKTEQGWSLAKDADFEDIPDTIQGIILSRTDQFQEEEKRVLQIASVIGRIFQKPILEELYEGLDLEGNLKSLQDKEVIYMRSVYPEKEFIFRHILTQETIYQNLLKSERKEQHMEIAQAIEERWKDELEEHYELLAHHYEEAGELEKTHSYLIDSAEKAESFYANEVAIEHYEKSIQIADELDDRQKQAYAYEKLGELYFRIGEIEDSLDSYETSLRFYEESGIEEEPGSVYFEMGRIYRRWGNLGKAHEYWQEALEISDKYEKKELNIVVKHRLIALYRDWGNLEKAKKLNEELYELSETRDDPELEKFVYTNRGLIKEKVGNFEGAINNFQTCLEKALENDDRAGEAYALNVLGRNFYKQSQFEKALEHCRQSREMSKDMGYKEGVAWSSNHLGKIQLRLGELNKAQELLNQALNTSQNLNYKVLQADTLEALSSVNRRLGNFDKTLKYQKKGLELTEELGDENLIAEQLYAYGTALRDTGRIKEAFEKYEESLKTAEKVEDSELLSKIQLSLGALNFKCGQYEKAQNHLKECLSVANKIGDRRGTSYAKNTLSELWSDVGNWKKAQDLAEESLEIAQETGNKDSLPISYTLLGRAYFRKGDLDKQEELYQKAINAAEEIGIEQFKARSKYERSYLAWEKGNKKKAIELSEEALKMNKQMGEKLEEPRFALRDANLKYKVGEIDEAKEKLENLLPVVQQYNQLRYIWSVHFYLAQINSDLDKSEKANSHLENCVRAQINIDQNLTPEMQQTYWEPESRTKPIHRYLQLSDSLSKNISEDIQDFAESIGILTKKT